MNHIPLAPDTTLAEAARHMMAEQLEIVREHLPALRERADVTAVHETRKAIRRTFTLFKLFAPSFAPGELEPHRQGLRKLMRRLAPCRDLAVFRANLLDYNTAAGQPLLALADYVEEMQAAADQRLIAYLQRPRTQKRMKRYARFTTTEGAGLLPPGEKAPLVLVRHVLPVLIFQRLGAVRAWGDILPTATPVQFHQLRIQFKELRYTLTFFEDLLGETSGQIIEMTRQMQEHLGHLNDASVAVAYLVEIDCCPEEVAVYGDYQRNELTRLTQEFYPLYAQFDRRDVRQVLALTVASL